MSGSSTIGKAALVVSAGILLSRVLGWVRNAAILALLGIGRESSLYITAFTIPDFLTFLLAGGYLSITLVPLLSRHLVVGDDDETMRTFTAVFRIVGLAFVVLAGVTIVGAGWIVATVFPEVEDQARLTSLTRIALASQVFFGTGILLMAAQYAKRRFTLPSLAPLVYNLGIIGGGLVGWALGDPSPEAFLWGGLVGAAVGNFGLQALGAHRLGYRLIPSTPWRHPAVKEYFTLALPLMLGISAVALDEQWPRLFGQYAGEDGAAALASARTLNMLPVGVIAQAAGVAAYPFLAGLAAEGRIAEMGSTLLRSVRNSVAVGGLAAGIVGGLTVPIVTLAYGYGEVTSDNTTALASLLLFYCVSIPFWPAHQVYTRGFYALQRMWTPVLIGSAVTVVLVPILWFLVNRNGAAGVAAGSTFGVILYTVCVGLAWHVLVSRVDAMDMILFALRVLVVAVGCGLATFGVSVGLDEAGLPSLIRLGAGSVIGAVVYVAAAQLVGVGEVRQVLDQVVDRVRRLRHRSEDPATTP
ncbi:MAG: murein biosynthesis integral membrane protein MurJ [Acidimicrobiales bacterium]